MGVVGRNFRIVHNSFGLKDMFVSRLMAVDTIELGRELLLAIGIQSTGVFTHVINLCFRKDNMVSRMEAEEEQQRTL